MANFCRKCGSPVTQDQKFCRKCGCALTPTDTQSSAQQRMNTWQPQEAASQQTGAAGRQTINNSAARVCPHCGKAVRADSRFCLNCGRPLTSYTQLTTQQMTQPEVPQGKTFNALSSAGEYAVGDIEIPGMPDVNAAVQKVLGPVSGIIRSVRSFLEGVLQIFKKPSVLIGTVVLAAFWFIMSLLPESDSGILKWISWITYSKGGLDRSGLGIIGGVIGKSTVAAAIISLFSGGLMNTFKGIGVFFKGHGEKRGFLNVLIGCLIGNAAYIAFVGSGFTSGASAVTGIAGAMLSLEALGSCSGKIYDLLQSLTSRSVNGVRIASRGRCDGILTGMTLGFALAATMSVLI